VALSKCRKLWWGPQLQLGLDADVGTKVHGKGGYKIPYLHGAMLLGLRHVAPAPWRNGAPYGFLHHGMSYW